MIDEIPTITTRREMVAEGLIGLIFSAYLEPGMVKECIAQPGAVRAAGRCVGARYIGTDNHPDYELVLEGRSGRRATITANAHHALAFETWEEAVESK